MKVVINNLCGFPALNIDDNTNIEWTIASQVSQFLAEYHGVIIRPSDVRVLPQSSASADDMIYSVVLPNRAFLPSYPVHLIEFEYAVSAVCFSHLGNPCNSRITIWINNAPDYQNWNITTFEMDPDGLPKFEEHFISRGNIEAVWEMFPPTDEVRDRHRFLQSVCANTTNNLDAMFTRL